MTHPIRSTAAVVAAGALLLPAAASAEGPGRGGPDFAGQGDVPARVQAKVKRVLRTLDRAEDHVSDGSDSAALTTLTRLDRAVASAQRVAIRRAATDSGPASVGRVAGAADKVAVTTAELLDGASEDLSTGLAGSLDSALDSRDALVAAVGALDADAQGDHADVLADLAEDSTDEAEAFTEGAADDELTAGGQAALTAAAEQATATAAAATALAGDDTVADEDGDVAGEESSDRGDCPPGGAGERGGRGPREESSASTQEGLSRRA